MARITRLKLSDFEKLRSTDSNLFHALLEATKAEKGGEIVQVDSAFIKGEAFKLAWSKFVERNSSIIVSTEQPTDELWQAEQAQAKRDAQKAHDEQAIARANWWITEGGLLPSDHNLQLIQRFIREKTQGLLSGDNVDLAVSQLREQLQWKPRPAEPVAPAAPPPAEPAPEPVLAWVEVVGPNGQPQKKTDGSFQLPLDVVPNKRHTTIQLQDWSRRTREEQAKQARAANNQVAAEYAAANQPLTLEV